MIEIKNLSGGLQHVNSLKKIGGMVLTKERKDHLDLSIVLLGEKRMQEINRVYRGKNEVTNVLSFFQKELGLGELVLCPAKIRKDAQNYGIIFKAELYRIFIHGLLHLLGYNHETEKDFQRMLRKEKFYARTI